MGDGVKVHILKSNKPIFVEVLTDSQQKIFDAFKDY